MDVNIAENLARELVSLGVSLEAPEFELEGKVLNTPLLTQLSVEWADDEARSYKLRKLASAVCEEGRRVRTWRLLNPKVEGFVTNAETQVFNGVACRVIEFLFPFPDRGKVSRVDVLFERLN